MRHILAYENRSVLARFAALPALYAFDFDGTLAPIVADPSEAQMRPQTAALLSDLGRRRPCAVISGRARADLTRRLGEAPLAAIVGNHGIEGLHMDAAYALTIARVRAAVGEQLEAIEGVVVEDKTFTLAVHHRRAPDVSAARAAIHEVLATVPRISGVAGSIRTLGGELVVNVIPAGAPHKGDALLGLVDRGVFGAALYVGDDETDEDVFRLEGAPEVLSIRVGYSRDTSASYFLEHQSEIDLLLEALLTQMQDQDHS